MKLTIILFLTLIFSSCNTHKQIKQIEPLSHCTVLETKGIVRVENGLIAVDIKRSKEHISLSFKAKDKNNSWVTVCESFKPDFQSNPKGNLFFNTKVTPYRYQLSSMINDFTIITNSDEKVIVRLTGISKKTEFEQILCLEKGNSFFDIAVKLDLEKPLIDYAMNSFTFNSQVLPEFIHTPSIKKTDHRSGPDRDQVIGDHSFDSPAIILQKGHIWF